MGMAQGGGKIDQEKLDQGKTRSGQIDQGNRRTVFNAA
jgi:hypothetical protein